MATTGPLRPIGSVMLTLGAWVALNSFAAGAPPLETAQPDSMPFVGMTELPLEALVEQVLARNPSLAQMVAAWQAASARYPQATSLDDPMFGSGLGPASIGSPDVEFAYRLEVSQKYPFPGKLRLRGQSALAEASAAGHDVSDLRLQLVEMTKTGFYDFFLIDRALAVNAEALGLLREFRQNAESRYKTGLVTQQDVLQADVEIGRQRERQLTLERMRHVVVARLNTLMHLPPNASLPPPPARLPRAETTPGAEVLSEWALARRPDLQALADRVAAEQATLALAQREYCPDFEVMAAYDAFWQRPEQDLRPQIAVRMNLPVRRSRRAGAIAEAQARITQRRAELDRATDQVRFQVQESWEQVRESTRLTGLYEETILPAAVANVRAAQSAYVTGKVPFLSLLEAERNLVGLRDRYFEVLSDYHRRRAALERAIGGPLPTMP